MDYFRGVFKRSVAKICESLASVDVAKDIKPVLNESKPRKGSFVVTVNGDVVFELLELKRPFKALRDTDMSSVVDDIVAALPTKKSMKKAKI